MTMTESDGLEEAAERTLRTALMAAAQLAEHLAQARQRDQQHTRQLSEAQLRDTQRREQADRAAARAELSGVRDSRWWDTATADDITHAYSTAHQWAAVDPAADAAEQRIRTEVHTRYGIDLPAAGTPLRPLTATDPAAADPAAARAETERARAEVAAVLIGDARAEALTAGLAGITDEDTVTARVLADQFQAHPAADATATPPAVDRGDDLPGPARTRQLDTRLDTEVYLS